MSKEKDKVLITCEHGGQKIPQLYAAAFEGAEDILASHRGIDIGALQLYKIFKEKAADFGTHSQISRLLVELNRSLHHPKLFSEYTSGLEEADKEKILQLYYFPYRNEVEQKIKEWVNEGHRVLHVSIHTFTPILDGKIRKTDLGFLYDPGREREQLFAAHWRQHLLNMTSTFKIRYNYPYQGTADGLVTYLRKHFSDHQYAGLELEVNQRFPKQEPALWKQLQDTLVQSFLAALQTK